MVAAQIRLCREVRGWSQEELEVAAGLGRGYVSRIESGSRGRQLSVDTVVEIARALKIDLAWLITGQGRTPFGISKGAGFGAGGSKQQALPFGGPVLPKPSSKALKTPGKASPQRPPKQRSPGKPQREPQRLARPVLEAPGRAKKEKPRKR
jgi:transcriptional regulator with XRE-family HTH domain